MKKKITCLFLAILILPAIFFTGCKKSEENYINYCFSTTSSVTATTYTQSKSTVTKSLDISNFTANEQKIDSAAYLKFLIKCDSVYIYKKFVKTISFMVVANEDASDMTFLLKMDNLAPEDDLTSANQREFSVSKNVKANVPVVVNFDINYIVPSATGSNITIDISESKNKTVADSSGNLTDFKWAIYGLSMTGESKAF